MNLLAVLSFDACMATDSILGLADSPEKNVLLRVQSDAPRDQFVVNKEYK